MSTRYQPLGDYLQALDAATSEVTLSYDDVERIIGATLPASATRHHGQWWANQTGGSRAPHWTRVGFQVNGIDVQARQVRFTRILQPLGLSIHDPDLQQVISAVNEHGQSRPIGGLQVWRKNRHQHTRVASRSLFPKKTNPERNWIFHVGGLSELQFNIGLETAGDTAKFRHGVAFSLQPTREMPEITPLLPKIERFNEYLRIYPNAFEGLSMWYFKKGVRSSTYPVTQISDELLRPNFFIFIGALQPSTVVSVDWILDDFDRLLQLYKFVEGTEEFPELAHEKKQFQWSPGNKARKQRTSFERGQRSIDTSLRHNILQDALFMHLEEMHGTDNCSGEQDCGIGTRIDVAVREGSKFIYYEIKTGLSARSCIREALGQLLEYAFWPGAQEASRLVVVGEHEYTHDAAEYLECLRKEFSLPIEYQCFDLKQGVLVSA